MTALPPPQDEWRTLAKCRGMDPEIFYPERGDVVTLRTAKSVCESCPVTGPCLEFALDMNEREGVFGGKSAKQRRELRSAQAERNRLVVCQECGTEFLGHFTSRLCSAECRHVRAIESTRRFRDKERAAS